LENRWSPLDSNESHDRWSLDFASDQFLDGRRLCIVVVVDDCTRESLALVADTAISPLAEIAVDSLLPGVRTAEPRDAVHTSAFLHCNLSATPAIFLAGTAR
jgi:hypothetical protein